MGILSGISSGIWFIWWAVGLIVGLGIGATTVVLVLIGLNAAWEWFCDHIDTPEWKL